MNKPRLTPRSAVREAAEHRAAARAVRELLAKLQRLIDRGQRL
jgi:hypothetical protein